jgi:Na+-transporting methylmalonyl-CoA/oxaloacetate decarboxylase gamma subunit
LESSLISGPVMSLIGISTVFVVLVSLVTVVSAMRRWLGEAVAPASGSAVSAGQTEPDAASGRESKPAGEPDEQPEKGLLLVALATYAYHRSRGVSATAPAQTTEWSSAGRVRQIASFRR